MLETIMNSIKLYGIIGKPLEHSLSPKLHNWAFPLINHLAMFKAWTLEPAHLEDFISAMHSLRICGLCVTIPFKQSIIPFLDVISPRAKSVGAVNTLYWQGDKLCGENTDIDGCKLPLLQKKPADISLVLGAGGAARAAIMALLELNIKNIYVSARNEKACKELAHHFNIHYQSWDDRERLQAQWILNTTPLGMKGALQEQSPYSFSTANEDFLAYDLVYNPMNTKFLLDAKQCGYSIQNGLDMFVGQALSQMKLWTGKAVCHQEACNFILKYL